MTNRVLQVVSLIQENEFVGRERVGQPFGGGDCRSLTLSLVTDF